MVIARAALHFWEEPPLSGEAGSGAVFFSHCPLQCVYCQNAHIAKGKAGKAVSVSRLAEICLELQGRGALNVNFVTPTHYSDQVAQAVELARGKGLSLPVVWNTSGYELPAVVELLSGTVDIWLDDYKYADGSLSQRYSRAGDYPEVALAALDKMVEMAGEPRFDEVDDQPRLLKGVVVRHLMLPGALRQSMEALDLLFERYGDKVLYSIMNQYTPVMQQDEYARYPELANKVSDEEYEALLDHADHIGMEDYFWQNGPAAAESFIPSWDCSGV